VAVCKTVAFGFSKFESCHSHKIGESPVGRPASGGMKTVWV